jgi:hypothetical protein
MADSAAVARRRYEAKWEGTSVPPDGPASRLQSFSISSLCRRRLIVGGCDFRHRSTARTLLLIICSGTRRSRKRWTIDSIPSRIGFPPSAFDTPMTCLRLWRSQCGFRAPIKAIAATGMQPDRLGMLSGLGHQNVWRTSSIGLGASFALPRHSIVADTQVDVGRPAFAWARALRDDAPA